MRSKVKLKKGGRTLGMGGDVTVSELLGLSYIDYRRMMRILFCVANMGGFG